MSTQPDSDSKSTPAIRMWRHPEQPQIRVPYRSAAVVALMSMGVADYDVIGEAVGLTADEVQEIDMAEEATIRALCGAGIPLGEYFRLQTKVRCPRCSARTTIAPCAKCVSDAARLAGA